jgi:hypothetical protein
MQQAIDIRKNETSQKILLFVSIIMCVVLAVNL